VAYKHVREDPVPPSQLNPDVPPELDAVAMTALTKDPAARYPSGGAMREALSAAATGEMPAAVGVVPTEPLAGGDTAVMTQPATVPATVPPEERRGAPAWLPWAVIAVIVLALLVLAALTLGGDGQPRQAGQTDRPGEQPGGQPAEGTTPSPAEVADPVSDAYANLAGVLAAGQSAGEVDIKAFDKVSKEAQEAVEKYREGDLEGAAAELGEAHLKVQEALAKGEITSDTRAEEIHSAIEALGEAMRVTPEVPSPSPRGEGGGGDDDDD
jgi:hypothetical protein